MASQDPDKDLENMRLALKQVHVRDFMALRRAQNEVYNLARTGRITLGQAHKLSYMLSLMVPTLKALADSDLSNRLAEIEQRLGLTAKAPDPQGEGLQ